MDRKARIRNRLIETAVLVIAVIGVWVYMNFFGIGAAPHALNIDEIPPYEQYS